MRAVAIPMILLMLSASLAGCTSGDPDGNDNSGIDMEILNQMIDDNLQDFINNTSVTVNQEIHYHNNTTVVNNYDENTTWNMGGASVVGVNGTTGSIMYMIDITFTIDDLIPEPEPAPDYRNNTINYAYTYYDYLTNSERTDTFVIQCSDYYLVGSQSANGSFEVSYWNDSSNYWDAWVDQYNQTVANMLQEAAYDYYMWNGDNDYHVRATCDEGYLQDTLSVYDLVVLEITIPQGYAFDCAHGYDYHGIEYLYRKSPGEDVWNDIWNYNDGLSKYVYGDNWYCNDGIIGGTEETIMALMGNHHLDMDYDGLYRYVIYYQLIPVFHVE
jgi:hypothetical protein